MAARLLIAMVASLLLNQVAAAQWWIGVEVPLQSAITPRFREQAIKILSLSPEQTGKLDAIIQSHAAKFGEFRNEWEPRKKAFQERATDRTLTEIARWELNREKFQSLRIAADQQAAIDGAVLTEVKGILLDEQSAAWQRFLLAWSSDRIGRTPCLVLREAVPDLLDILQSPELAEAGLILPDTAEFTSFCDGYATEMASRRLALIDHRIDMERRSNEESEDRVQFGPDGRVGIGQFRHAEVRSKIEQRSGRAVKLAEDIRNCNRAAFVRLRGLLKPGDAAMVAWEYWRRATDSDQELKKAVSQWIKLRRVICSDAVLGGQEGQGRAALGLMETADAGLYTALANWADSSDALWTMQNRTLNAVSADALDQAMGEVRDNMKRVEFVIGKSMAEAISQLPEQDRARVRDLVAPSHPVADQPG